MKWCGEEWVVWSGFKGLEWGGMVWSVVKWSGVVWSGEEWCEWCRVGWS